MFEPGPFHPRRRALVAPVRVDPDGLAGPTRGQARGPHWRTTSRGLVVPATVERSPEQRIVEAAAVLPERGAVTGWAALRWGGGTWFDGTRDGKPAAVPLVTPSHVLAQPGFVVSQEFLAPHDIAVVDELPLTSELRSVVYEMRYAAGLGEAVVALDMACFNDLVGLAEVAAYLEALGPVTGIQQARDALAEGDENSWSPRETMMRDVWTRVAGLARPLTNQPVFTLDGKHVGTPDTVDPGLGLLGQYNGMLHLTGTRVAQDLKTEAAYRELGLEPVTMVAADWADLDDFVVRLLAAAHRARARARAEPRQWTIQPPDWWTPTVTVAQRRALNEGERDRYLRYRHAA